MTPSRIIPSEIIPSLNVFALIVADMPTTLGFYRALGLDIPADADKDPHVQVPIGDTGVKLAFDAASMVRSFMPGYQPSQGNWGSLAFACATPAEVDQVFTAMTSAGYHGETKPWDAFWGQRYAVLHDPDGNGVDLFAALPAT